MIPAIRSIRLASATGTPRLPLLCAPLVGADAAALEAEARAVAAMGPDLLEWRVDFFARIGEPDEVAAVAARLRRAGGLPLLFTRRHPREGGQPAAIDEAQVALLYRAVCAGGHVDLVDIEMANDAAQVESVCSDARAHGVGVVLSFHDFGATPDAGTLTERFRRAERMGADVAKVAVMPHDMNDVLTLLGATWRASQELSIPVVGMAMGPLGAVTRLAGAAFGSALSFGVGQAPSAPGQTPLADLRAATELLARAMGART